MEVAAIFVQNRVFCLPHLHSTPPLREFPSEQRHPVWYGKTRMVWLPDGEKNSKICLFISTQLTNVTDGRTPHDDVGCAYASHHAAKINIQHHEDQRNRGAWKTELIQARSKPDTVNRPGRIFVHHYNSTQYCNTEILCIYIPLPRGNSTASFLHSITATHT